MKILLVDDETVAVDSLRRVLRRRGYRDIQSCSDGKTAVKLLKKEEFDIVLLDLLMPGMDGMQVLEAVKPFRPATEFIMLTAVDDAYMAVKALRMGAYDYLVKPVDNDRLLVVMERAYERKGLLSGLAGASSGAKDVNVPEPFSDILTRSHRMMELLTYAQIMARSGNSVLITGESGTGKELLAKGIHRGGPSSKGPFVAVNVSSVSESLFESQFFGHARGSFTGATHDYAGFFEQASGGTLFLDEIGDLHPNLQVKFLRVLEDKSVRRLGDARLIPVEVRIVSATNRNLEKACQEGRFRLDLMYRLKQAHVHLPPLREREGDIMLLADHFMAAANQRHVRNIKGFSREAMEILGRREYPGNVRELAQVVEHAVLIADTEYIQPSHLDGNEMPPSPFVRRLCTLKEDADRHVAYVISQANGDRKKAAAILGVTVRQVQRRLAEMKEDPQWSQVLRDI